MSISYESDREAREADLIRRSDQNFFRRFPHRRHRLRRASVAEIRHFAEAVAAAGGCIEPPSDNERLYAVIRQVAPGARLRTLVVGPRAADLDQPEETVAEIYRTATQGDQP